MGDSGMRSTCIASVHNELCHLEGLSLGKAFAPDSNFAGIPNLRRPHQNLKGAVGDMLATLAHAHHVLTDLLGGKGDPCGEGTVSRTSPPPQASPTQVPSGVPALTNVPVGQALQQAWLFIA